MKFTLVSGRLPDVNFNRCDRDGGGSVLGSDLCGPHDHGGDRGDHGSDPRRIELRAQF